MGDKQKHGAKEGGRDEWETSKQKYSNIQVGIGYVPLSYKSFVKYGLRAIVMRKK